MIAEYILPFALFCVAVFASGTGVNNTPPVAADTGVSFFGSLSDVKTWYSIPFLIGYAVLAAGGVGLFFALKKKPESDL